MRVERGLGGPRAIYAHVVLVMAVMLAAVALFVVPARRGRGRGRSRMNAAIEAARRRGADYMDLGTSEDDVAARRLYESLGFTNREGRPDGPVMYFYEREL